MEGEEAHRQGESEVHLFCQPWKGSCRLRVRERSGMRKKLEKKGAKQLRASKDK